MTLHIQPYDFEIKYRPGQEMVLAGAISRMNLRPGPQIDMDQTIQAVHLSNERLSQMQNSTNQDEELFKLKEIITKGWPETSSGAVGNPSLLDVLSKLVLSSKVRELLFQNSVAKKC